MIAISIGSGRWAEWSPGASTPLWDIYLSCSGRFPTTVPARQTRRGGWLVTKIEPVTASPGRWAPGNQPWRHRRTKSYIHPPEMAIPASISSVFFPKSGFPFGLHSGPSRMQTLPFCLLRCGRTEITLEPTFGTEGYSAINDTETASDSPPFRSTPNLSFRDILQLRDFFSTSLVALQTRLRPDPGPARFIPARYSCLRFLGGGEGGREVAFVGWFWS